MCELFAMNSKFPTDVNFSLQEFARHSGEPGLHKDGWGVAFAMHRDFKVIKEPMPARDSACVQYIEHQGIRSEVVISHIRKASSPKVLTYENTHPFDRELYGRRVVFAHNGHVPDLHTLPRFGQGRFMPMGQTDSEQIFCYLLNRIVEHIPDPAEYNEWRVHEVLAEYSPRIRALGKFNFLFSDGQYLFAHGDTSLYSVCRSCHLEHQVLEDEELRVLVSHGTGQDVGIVATVPLTPDEAWSKFEPGEIRIFRDGKAVLG